MPTREMRTEERDHLFIAEKTSLTLDGVSEKTIIMLTESNDDEACAVFTKEELRRFIALLQERYDEIV